MRVLFWGTPEFAVPCLRALLGEGHEVVGVVTQPDRPAGRGRKLKPSAVREVAEAFDLPVLTPERPRGEAFLEEIGALAPEISVVVAYGHILRPEVLELPLRGSLNVHASLLPELRGAAPVHWAIVRGYSRSGVTIMRMSAGMDEGPILLQRETPIAPEDTVSSLLDRLSELGAAALIEALLLLELGAIEEREQDPSLATYAPKLSRDLAQVSWAGSAREVADHIRGMDETPGAWTLLAGEPVKVFRPTVLSGAPQGGEGAPPGMILEASAEGGLIVATGGGWVTLGEVQPAGGRRMSSAEWIRGGRVLAGTRFGA
jgi:methionyl-tRNA formyltransferase